MLNRLDMTYSVLVCGDSRVTREDHLTIHSITEDNQDHNTKELGGWFTNHLPLKKQRQVNSIPWYAQPKRHTCTSTTSSGHAFPRFVTEPGMSRWMGHLALSEGRPPLLCVR